MAGRRRPAECDSVDCGTFGRCGPPPCASRVFRALPDVVLGGVLRQSPAGSSVGCCCAYFGAMLHPMHASRFSSTGKGANSNIAIVFFILSPLGCFIINNQDRRFTTNLSIIVPMYEMLRGTPGEGRSVVSVSAVSSCYVMRHGAGQGSGHGRRRAAASRN